MYTSTVIQAGGRSSRMGQDKGLVPLAGKPLIAHAAAAVSGLTNELLLTTNRPEAYAWLGVPMFEDVEPGAGALPGLATALKAAQGEWVLIVACDMPFLNRELLAEQLRLARSSQADAIVPLWEERYQPFHTVYRREVVLQTVQAQLDEGFFALQGLFERLNCKLLGPDEIERFSPNGRSFFNINRPADLARAEALLNQP